MQPTRPASTLLRADDGAAMVELAFVLPIFLLLVWGVIEFGRLLYTANNLTTAVREGARYAAVQPTVSANDPNVQAVVIRAFVPLGSAGGLNTKQITVSSTKVSGSVVVSATYQLFKITPLATTIGPLTASATFRRER